MPPPLRTEPLDEITFRCSPCKRNFKSPNPRIEDAPERDWHPWRYFAPCPDCGQEREQVYWERNFLKMLASPPDPRNCGPKTEEGRHNCGANLRALLADPERRARRQAKSRFNGMKHGLYAKVATYFPARPGHYPHCTGCPYREDCGTWEHGACLHRTELFMRHRLAFQQKDPDALRDINADNQAQIQAIFSDIILAIVRTGVEIKTPEWFPDKEGNVCMAEFVAEDGELKQIMKVEAHPLLKPMFEILSRNNMTLADMRMTPKVREQEEALQGFLAARDVTEETMTDFAARQTDALERLAGLIERSRDKQKRDPVLIEHQRDGEE